MFNWLKNKKTLPAFWLQYLEIVKAQPSRHTPLEELTYVVFDTETTGLNDRKDKILSIGAVKVSNNRFSISESLDFRLYQEYEVKQEAIQIHGLLPGKPEQQLSEIEAIQQFLKFVGNSIVVGHHVAFDVAMINRVLKRQVGNVKLKNKCIDTRNLAIRVEHVIKPDIVKPGNYTLDALCKRYHISMSDRHTAAGDAYITAVLLLKLIHRLKKRNMTNYGQLLKQNA